MRSITIPFVLIFVFLVSLVAATEIPEQYTDDARRTFKENKPFFIWAEVEEPVVGKYKFNTLLSLKFHYAMGSEIKSEKFSILINVSAKNTDTNEAKKYSSALIMDKKPAKKSGTFPAVFFMPGVKFSGEGLATIYIIDGEFKQDKDMNEYKKISNEITLKVIFK